MFYAEAGHKLAELLTTTKTDVITVDIAPDMLELADSITYSRRMLAKAALKRVKRDLKLANELAKSDQGAYNLDKRAILSELLVYELLTSAGVDFSHADLVDFKPDSNADLTISNKLYDIKAASQMSIDFSARVLDHKFYDDKLITIRCLAHEEYIKNQNFAGYVCVYLFIDDDVAVKASIFKVSADDVTVKNKACRANASGAINSVNDYYSVQVPFSVTTGFDKRRAYLKHKLENIARN